MKRDNYLISPDYFGNFSANLPSLTVAEKIAEEAKNNCGIDGTAWLEEIRRLHSTGVYSQEENIEVQYFTIGKWCVCGKIMTLSNSENHFFGEKLWTLNS